MPLRSCFATMRFSANGTTSRNSQPTTFSYFYRRCSNRNIAEGPPFVFTKYFNATLQTYLPDIPVHENRNVSITTFIVHYFFQYRVPFVSQVPFEVLESLSTNKTLFNLILENYPNLLLCRSSSVNQINKPSANNDHADGRTASRKPGSRSDTPPLVMKMKLKQSKMNSSTGSDVVVSPLQEFQTVSPPQAYVTADNSPERNTQQQHRVHHHSVLKRQFSITQSSYFKSLPYHRSV